MTNIKAIETRYKGYRFRSRLEARWAVFFDELRIIWEYEPEGYELNEGRRYLPDFWLPNVSLRGDINGIFIEIKPNYPDDEECSKYTELAHRSDKSLVLLCGSGFTWGCDNYEGFEFNRDGSWDNCMGFMKCPFCRHVKVEFFESNYMNCPRCGRAFGKFGIGVDSAVAAARSARFEHGEGGGLV